MSACYGIQKKVDLLCRKFDTEEGKPRTADALMSDWMREVGHIDYSNACAFYEKDKMFTLHVADVMSRSTNRTGVNRFWEKECAISWEWAMSPMARAIRQKISDMRERICTCIKRNCELMIEPQGRVLEQRARANEKRGLPGQHVADGCLFVLEGYADEFGREVRKLIADWKSSNAMSVREQHHYEKRFFHCRVHARRDDHNLSVFLKTSSSEWFIDQDANEGPLLIDSDCRYSGENGVRRAGDGVSVTFAMQRPACTTTRTPTRTSRAGTARTPNPRPTETPIGKAGTIASKSLTGC